MVNEAKQKPPRRYEKMRDSGVEWIGMVPENATIVRLKHLTAYIESGTSVNAGQSPAQNSEFGILKTSCVSKFVFSPGENKSVNLDEYDRVHCPVCHNTIIVSRMNTPDLVGACGYVDRDYPNLFLPDRLWQVHFKTSVNVKYLWYYLQSCAVRQYYASLATGTSSSMQNISQQQFLNVPVVLFPDTFAFQIVSFLDNKCQQIDALIAEARASIEEYKTWKASIIYEAVTKGLAPHAEMKDSGVKWIGEMPKAWTLQRAKRHVMITHGMDPKTEGDIPVYGSGAESFKTCGEYKIGPAVLLGRKGATLNIPHYIEGRYWNVDTAFDAKTDSELNLKYYYYLATCFDYKYYTSQTTLPGMTQTSYNNMLIPIPPLQEQRNIVSFVDEKCRKVDDLIVEKKSLIFDLESYKKSLIYEVVTGKRKVI